MCNKSELNLSTQTQHPPSRLQEGRLHPSLLRFKSPGSSLAPPFCHTPPPPSKPGSPGAFAFQIYPGPKPFLVLEYFSNSTVAPLWSESPSLPPACVILSLLSDFPYSSLIPYSSFPPGSQVTVLLLQTPASPHFTLSQSRLLTLMSYKALHEQVPLPL